MSASSPDDDTDEGLPFVGFGPVALAPFFDQILKEAPGILKLDPIKLATCFAGLLTLPKLQSNCVRLEILTHAAIGLGGGHRKPSDKVVSDLFRTLGDGIAGRLEDPAEDVFVSLVYTRKGNFRVLEGIWESAGFHLQKIVEALEDAPEDSPFDEIRSSIYALLRLSDSVCERAKLSRYEIGDSDPAALLKGDVIRRFSSIRRILRFSTNELTRLGITTADLSQFTFRQEDRLLLRQEAVGNSSLERFPLCVRSDFIYVILPTAISAAIRRFVIEAMEVLGTMDAFTQALASAFGRCFTRTPLLGSGTSARFRRQKNALFAGATKKVDEGRYLNLIFVCDSLQNFRETGLMGYFPVGGEKDFVKNIKDYITAGHQRLSDTANFTEVVTLIVFCGVGRGVALPRLEESIPGHRIDTISAADLLTLCWLPGFKALDLWRIYEAIDRLQALNIELHNINGLLNLIGWARSLGGHLVPHGSMPEAFVSGGFVMIEQNALLRVRREALVSWDPHAALDMDGTWTPVRKAGQSFFDEDRERASYYADEDPSATSWPRGLHETAQTHMVV